MADKKLTTWEFLHFIWQFIYKWMEAIVLAFVPTSVIAKDISGQTVLITGAGSGIGRLLALRFASHNCRLALWDVNLEGAKETGEMAREMGATVRTYQVDVSDKDQVYKTATQVSSDIGPVDILVNNAGIVTGQNFLDCSNASIEKTMQVNSMAHFWTVKAFLPAMLSRGHGHLVTVASSAGLVGVPGLSDYCASKFAAVGFDESLRYEIESLGHKEIHTTLVCPYLIATNMFKGCEARFPSVMDALDPTYVSEKILDAVLRNQELLILPRQLNIFFALKGFLPEKSLLALSNFMGASSMMNKFERSSTMAA